ncbi:MAG: hypothetical protein F4218_02620 [Synechococcus sp. SB0677_bin_5]|nr:hypothetical protein [Synechococcus sp. SB0677_bin_5]
MTLGSGTLALQQGGHTWRGPFQTVHAWSAGQATGTNPTGTGSATWRGSAEAVSTADLLHLRGTVRLHIPELGQPMLDAQFCAERTGGLQRRGASAVRREGKGWGKRQSPATGCKAHASVSDPPAGVILSGGTVTFGGSAGGSATVATVLLSASQVETTPMRR